MRPNKQRRRASPHDNSHSQPGGIRWISPSAEIIPDGGRVHVDLLMCDAAQQEVAMSHARVFDALGGTARLHQPGFRMVSDGTARDARAQVDQAYDQMVARQSQAWRTPIRDVGPACLQNHVTKLHGLAADLQGRLDQEAADREDEEVEDSRPLRDARRAQAARDAAWQEMIQRQSNAWRDASPRAYNSLPPPQAAETAEGERLGQPSSRYHLETDKEADEREKAREIYKKRMSEAWRPENQGPARGDVNAWNSTAARFRKETLSP